MDIRDPLFSIILFFLLILIGVLFGIIFENIKKRLKEKKISSFLDNFELDLDMATSLNSLYLLGKANEKIGDFETALKIYLFIYKTNKDISLLKDISSVYLKAGFLLKAKKSIYSYLEIRPRDVEMLKLLIIVDEKLGELKEIVDILEIFEELDVVLEKEKANALFKLLNRGCDLDFCKEVKTLDQLYKKYPFIKREYLEYLFRVDHKKAYELIKEDEVYKFIDLYFFRNDIPNQDKFIEILAAKSLAVSNNKAIFEIEVLKNLNKPIATLEFEYVCNSCKEIFPIYSTRCPKCNDLFSMEVIINLTEKFNSNNYIEF